MRVGVVGGGVVGLAMAEAIARRGAEVVVLEAARCGMGASHGNAGWVTPGLAGPLPAPGVMRQSLRWLADPASPLYVHPTLRRDFLAWSWRFARSARPAAYRKGMRALVALGAHAIPTLDELAARGVDFEMHADGLLFVALDPRALAHVEEDFAAQRELGYTGEVERLDAAGARALEPALADAVVGAVFARAERHVRPDTLVAGLAAHLRGRGVELREGTRVLAATGRAVATPDGPEAFDAVVLAAGVPTRLLLRPHGIRLPLEAARGYSLTASGSGTPPARPVYLLEAKVGGTPFRDGFRLAGTLELAARRPGMPRRRLDAIANAADRYLRDWRPDGARAEWGGDRPLAPDGLPVIGEVPGQPGLYVATGHGMLGVTLATATAEALAPAVVAREPAPAALAPFRMNRF